MTENQIIANLIINELLPRLKRKGIKIQDSPITPKDLSALAKIKSLGIFTTHDIRLMLDERLA
jgi:Asp-tRNA(Asn)/Glu-tRNA(Gln) amidotransferase B subunit